MTDPTTEKIPPEVGVRSLIGDAVSRIRTVFSGSGDGAIVARGASWSLFITTGGIVIGFGSQLILTRTLGEEGYGIYAYALGWINTILVFAILDFGHAAVRFVGSYAGAGDWGKVKSFLRQMMILVFGVTTLIAVGAAALLVLNKERFTAEELNAYLFACGLLPVTAVLTFLASVLVGLRRVVLAQAPDLVLRPILFVAGFVAWGVVSTAALSPAVAIAANLAGSIVAVVVSGWGLLAVLPEEWRRAEPKSEFSFWLKTIVGLFAVSASQGILSGKFDVVVVGTLLGPGASGLYTLALLMSQITMLGVNAVYLIGSPMIAEYHANRSREDLQRLITPLIQVGVLVSVPAILVVAVFGRWALTTFFGNDFEGAYPILLVTLLSTLQGTIVGMMSGTVMTMTGHQNAAAKMVAVAAGVYLVLVVPLSSAFGAVGTATATFVAYMVRSILLTWYIRTRLKINILPIPWPVPA